VLGQSIAFEQWMLSVIDLGFAALGQLLDRFDLLNQRLV
jgi:hypothetical protein